MTATSVDAIDWPAWKATDRATLCFVVRAGSVLLIRKKRGLGAGKVNGPGGRIEDGESALDCAIRETVEELRVRPYALCAAGRLQFQFVDGYGIDVSVFRAACCAGEPRETEEAVPLWTPVDAIPYDEMWEDDRIWLPSLLAGEPFHGRFVFREDRILDHRMVDPPRPLNAR